MKEYDEIIFDLEGDGLLDEVTKIHCLSYHHNGKTHTLTSYPEMINLLSKTKRVVGHNITLFDLKVLKKILNFEYKGEVIDTLGLSWYLFDERKRHGLDVWGEELGFSKPPIDDWSNLSIEDYTFRCESDVEINRRLWIKFKDLLEDIYDTAAGVNKILSYIQFKMDCLSEQEDNKWELDYEAAVKHRDKLLNQQQEKVVALKQVMPKVEVWETKTRPKKPYKKDGTLSAIGLRWQELCKEHNKPEKYYGEIQVLKCIEEPNPNSHIQLKDWLYGLGWKPTSFKYERDKVTNKTKEIPQIYVDSDEGKILCSSVSKLIEKEPGIAILQGLTTINHRLSIFNGFLSESVKDEDGRYWLKARAQGFTNTLRFKHRELVNLPGVARQWGKEIRGCLIAGEGEILCGSDMVSLEDTTKRHFIYEYDPEYVNEMNVEGFDPHMSLLVVAKRISLEDYEFFTTSDPKLLSSTHLTRYKALKAKRSPAKTTNYAALYGVKPPKLARDMDCSVEEAKELLDAFWEKNWSILKTVQNAEYKVVNRKLWLYNPISKLWYPLRHEKDIFSTLNQGTGVYCFDRWLFHVRKKAKIRVGQFHDEGIWRLKPKNKGRFEALLHESISVVNNELKLNIELRVDVQFGQNYSEIH